MRNAGSRILASVARSLLLLAAGAATAQEKPGRSSLDPSAEFAAEVLAWRSASVANRLASASAPDAVASDAAAGINVVGAPSGVAVAGAEDYSGAYPADYWRVDPSDPPAATIDCVLIAPGGSLFYSLRPEHAAAGLVGVRILGFRESPGPVLGTSTSPDAVFESSPAPGGGLAREIRLAEAFDACPFVRVQFVFADGRSVRRPMDAIERVVLTQGDAGPLVPLAGGFPSAPADKSDAKADAHDGPQIPQGYLRNISTRGRVGLGAEVMIAGVIVSGTEPKNVLVRGLGPTLAAFGVADALPDPTLKLFRGGEEIANNDDWRTAANVALIGPNGPPNDREPAILMTLEPGEYTAILEGKGIVGNGLIEAYDEDEFIGVDSSQLGNISTRGRVGTGDSVMIAGIIIRGSEPKPVLVRALGPTLGGFGVPDVLANPTLRLVKGQTEIGFNDDWRDAPNADDITATGQAPANDREPAILVTLDPGEYTAIVAGAGDTVGNALVEVYGQAVAPFPGTVTSPLDGQTFSERVITVTGTIDGTAEAVLVDVDGRQQTIPVVDGSFSSPAVLTSGENTLTITPIAQLEAGGASRTLVEYARKILNVFCSAPPTEIWTQLTWGDPTSDVDLYCFQPNGQTVYFGNSRPSGGGFLDVDDTEGFGPEHYQISSANGDMAGPGEYHIRVHYYSNDQNPGAAVGRVLVYKNEEPFASVPFSLPSSDPGAAGFYDPASPSWLHIATVVVDECGNTDFVAEAGQKYGYDDVTSAVIGLDYKSVKQGDSDTVTLTSNATVENPRFLTSENTGVATVAPDQSAVSPTTVSITGVSAGAAAIFARRASATGEICDGITAAVYPERARTVAVRAVNLPGQAVPVVPSAADIQTHLNNVIYKQGIVTWTVTVLPAVEVDYDLNDDNIIDVENWTSTEMDAVIAAAKDDAYDANIFMVNAPSDGSFGFMGFNQRYGFVHPDTSPRPLYTIAHELGHGTFGLTHDSGLGVQNNMMTQGPQEKPRLFKGQWDLMH